MLLTYKDSENVIDSINLESGCIPNNINLSEHTPIHTCRHAHTFSLCFTYNTYVTFINNEILNVIHCLCIFAFGPKHYMSAQKAKFGK